MTPAILVWILVIFFNGNMVVVDNMASGPACEKAGSTITMIDDHNTQTHREYHCIQVEKATAK